MKVIVKVAFAVQLIWYVLFLTGLLARWTAGNEAVFDGITIVTAFYGIIVSNAYILMTRKLDVLAMVVAGLSFSIIFVWLFIAFGS